MVGYRRDVRSQVLVPPSRASEAGADLSVGNGVATGSTGDVAKRFQRKYAVVGNSPSRSRKEEAERCACCHATSVSHKGEGL